ncbi:LOW QUALITY PROTEIN: hypothetical protein JCM19045_3224 [Bacillus sp. JCM 19045]|nr:LOW QUALITY PROTEIN: hypothetical protein JCM19045_3224 [Bacillus sp. JCM 19045]
MTLSWRITLFSTGLVAVLILLVNVSVYTFFKANLTEGELDRVATQAITVASSLIQTSMSPEAREQYLNAYAPGSGMLRLIDEQGTILLTVTRNQELLDLPTAFNAGEVAALETVEEESYATASVPLIWNDGQIVSLQLTEQLEHYDESVPLLGMILTIASLVVLIPTFLASQALGRFIVRPIRSLAATMNDIRLRGTLKKVDHLPTQKDELADLSRSFNHMIELLQQNAEQQQQFVSDASHELKTPLTVIESYTTMLKRWGKDDQAMIDEAVEAILSESQRMKGLTEQMLLLANGETPTHKKQFIRLNRLVSETAERMSVASGRTIYVKDSNGPLYVTGSEPLLKQLLFILLDNGIKYSDKSLTLELRSSGSDNCSIVVIDQGIGIKAADQEDVFKRFYRVDKARSRDTGGSGLGLAIAQKIIAEHNGSLSLSSTEGVGSSFIVTLPTAKKEETDETN